MHSLAQLLLRKFQTELFFQCHYGKASSVSTVRPSPKTRGAKEFIKENYVSSCSGREYSEVKNSILKCRPRPSFMSALPLRRFTQVSSDNTIKLTCWNCNKVIESGTLFCNFCKSLQPFDKQANLFKILGTNHSYNLNQSELKQKFRNLQALLHPDKFSSKPKKEQELSEEYSSIVNKAYSTLLDPLERGLYLLSLNNVSIEEGTTDVDKTFLMEIMERNEEIESESDPQKLNEFNKVNREQLDFLISKITEAFDNNDIQLAKKLLTEMKYYNTIETKIKEIKQKRNIPD